MGIVSRMGRASVGDAVARAILGTAMTVVALALEWGLRRRASRADRAPVGRQ
jgi:hypothetical protein